MEAGWRGERTTLQSHSSADRCTLVKLYTNQDSWSYTGDADADSYSNVTVTVGENVTWNGAVDNDNNAKSATVTIESGATWVLTGNSYVSTLVNNGTIITNGYTLSASSSSGTGTSSATGSIPVTLGSTGWATLYTPAAMNFSGVSGLTAYATSFGDSEVTLTEVSQVPANTAVLLTGTESTTYSVPTLSAASDVSTDLSGTSTGLITTDSYNYYALGQIDDTTVGFKLVTTGVGIPAGKGYYALSATSSAPAYFVIGESATGISSTHFSNTTDSRIYDLLGRQVKKPLKGVYIQNGKKVIYE